MSPQDIVAYSSVFGVMVIVGLGIVYFFSRVQKQALDNYKELATSLEKDKVYLEGRISTMQVQLDTQKDQIEKLQKENASMVGYTALSAIIESAIKHFDARLDTLFTSLGTGSTINVMQQPKEEVLSKTVKG